MQAEFENKDFEMVAKLNGEIDHHTAKQMRERIDAAVEGKRITLLKLDFGGVTFMDSSGIGLIMGRYKLMQSMGGRLELINVPAHLKKLMVLAGISKLNVFQNQEDA